MSLFLLFNFPLAVAYIWDDSCFSLFLTQDEEELVLVFSGLRLGNAVTWTQKNEKSHNPSNWETDDVSRWDLKLWVLVHMEASR